MRLKALRIIPLPTADITTARVFLEVLASAFALTGYGMSKAQFDMLEF